MGEDRIMERFPGISNELLAWLKEAYPIRTPKLGDTEREIFYHAGQVDLIAELEVHHNAQVKRALLET